MEIRIRRATAEDAAALAAVEVKSWQAAYRGFAGAHEQGQAPIG
jgi:hypothetical protein